MQASNPQKSMRRRWIILGAVVLILVFGGLLVTGVLGHGRRTAGAAQPGDVAMAFIGDLSASVTAVGPVEPDTITHLSVDTPGWVESVLVQEGDAVQAGDVLVQLRTDELALRVQRAEQNLQLSQANLEALQRDPDPADIAAAEAAVASAQAQLDQLLAGPTEQEIAESEANVRAQEANLASASAAYRSTQDSIRASALAAAEADLVQAQIAYDEALETADKFPSGSTQEAVDQTAQDLEIAQAVLDEILAGPNPGTLNSAAAGVSAARANLEQARANHQLLLSGASDAQIAAARAGLAQAQANLASLKAGAADEAIAKAEAEVEKARLSLADTQTALDDASITAPFDGTVTAVYVDAGEYATSDVIELVSGDWNVRLSVDEVDVGTLAEGQPAIVTLETWPNVEIPATISSIAPSADVSPDGIVSFDVWLRLEDAQTDLTILAGMTADAHLITARRENVLLVPNAAVTADREAGTYTVNRVIDTDEGETGIQTVPVTIGLRDDEHTEITGGLKEGTPVALGELKTPAPRSGFFGGEGGR